MFFRHPSHSSLGAGRQPTNGGSSHLSPEDLAVLVDETLKRERDSVFSGDRSDAARRPVTAPVERFESLPGDARKHLRECAQCTSHFEEGLRFAFARQAGRAHDSVPEEWMDLARDLVARQPDRAPLPLRSRERPRSRPQLGWPAWGLGLAAAACLVVFLGRGIGLGGDKNASPPHELLGRAVAHTSLTGLILPGAETASVQDLESQAVYRNGTHSPLLSNLLAERDRTLLAASDDASDDDVFWQIAGELALGRVRAAWDRLDASRSRQDDPRYWILLAEVDYRRNRLAGAETSLRRALEMSPDTPAYRVNLAQVLVDQARPEDAKSELAKLRLSGLEKAEPLVFERARRLAESLDP